MTYQMRETVYGARYEETRSMSTTDVAKSFRADVKAAIKAGDLPKGLKLSIRTKYYSGGSSISVDIVAFPGRVLNAERIKWDAENPHGTYYNCPESVRELHNGAVCATLAKLEAMLDAYNFDGSDSQVDYFHVRFYAHVGVDYRLEKEERAILKSEGVGK